MVISFKNIFLGDKIQFLLLLLAKITLKITWTKRILFIINFTGNKDGKSFDWLLEMWFQKKNFAPLVGCGDLFLCSEG